MGNTFYLLDELSLVIETFLWAPTQGLATRISSIPTLTEQEKMEESFNSAAEIRIHPSGRWVYSSNRGHDSVSVFETGFNGLLQIFKNNQSEVLSPAILLSTRKGPGSWRTRFQYGFIAPN